MKKQKKQNMILEKKTLMKVLSDDGTI